MFHRILESYEDLNCSIGDWVRVKKYYKRFVKKEGVFLVFVSPRTFVFHGVDRRRWGPIFALHVRCQANILKC